MQTVWSRVVQTKCTCRCAHCISKTSAAGRRAALATSRKITLPGPSATFLYSTIFAAAVVADSKAKQKRRDQWDNAIGKLKEEIKDHAVQDNVTNEVLPDGAAVHDHDKGIFGLQATKSLRAAFTPLPADSNLSDNDTQEAINKSYRYHHDDDAGSGRRLPDYDKYTMDETTRDMPVHTGLRMEKFCLPPQSIYNLPRRREVARRRNWTAKKTRNAELQAFWLILRLIRSLDPSAEQLVDRSEELRTLASASTWYKWSLTTYYHKLCDATPDLEDFHEPRPYLCPQFQTEHDEEHQRFLSVLNTKLARMFGQVGDGSEIYKHRTVLRACDLLLTSQAAPDVRTYNILLSGFLRFGLLQLGNDLVDCITTSHIRPDEVTCAVILRYFINSEQPKRFSHYVAKMRGLYGGLMSADPTIAITEIGAPRLIRQGERVIQKVHPSSIVFQELIRGVMQFAGFERAIEIYSSMHSDGWGLDVRGLRMLLYHCIAQIDWDIGTVLWAQMKYLVGNRSIYLSFEDFGVMLALCKVCSKTKVYAQIFQEAKAGGHDEVKLSYKVRGHVLRYLDESGSTRKDLGAQFNQPDSDILSTVSSRDFADV